MGIAELERIAELASVRGIKLSKLAEVPEGLPERRHGRLAAS